MPSSQIERKLAAIMFTDIAGYTAQMSQDEDIAISLLETKQKILRPLIKKYKGQLIKEMGDGTLSHFPSSIDAINCSLELQKSLINNNKLDVRIGVHNGEVLFKNKDVFGDVVNIASRLETMSPAGGIIVSKNVYDELVTQQGFEGFSLGLQQLKNVGRLIEVFSLKADFLNVADPDDYINTKVEIHESNELPSVAIIPFTNKGDDKNLFYAYSISVDLISDLSEAGEIRVASLKDIDRLDINLLSSKELAEKLMVRYIVSGMLWKAGEKFQLSIELYDSKHHKVIWSDSWQENWDTLTYIKSNLADSVLKTLNITTEKNVSKDAINPMAYEYYLKGKYRHENRNNMEDVEIARGLFQKAQELEPEFILSEIELGLTYFFTGDYNKTEQILSESLKKSRVNNDKKSASHCLNRLGMLYRNQGNYTKAFQYHEKALDLREELGDKLGISMSLNNIGLVEFYQKNLNSALEYFIRSLKIKEKLEEKRRIATTLNNIALVYKNQGQYKVAIETMERALKIYLEIGAQKETSDVYYNMGNNLIDCHTDYKKALKYFKTALDIKNKLCEKKGIAACLYMITELSIFADIGDVSSSDLERCLEIRRKIGNAEEILEVLVLYFLIKQRKGYNISSIRKEIKKLIGTATNISYITYFRLHQVYNRQEVSIQYLQKAKDLIMSETENYPDRKKRKIFINGYFKREILRICKDNL